MWEMVKLVNLGQGQPPAAATVSVYTDIGTNSDLRCTLTKSRPRIWTLFISSLTHGYVIKMSLMGG